MTAVKFSQRMASILQMTSKKLKMAAVEWSYGFYVKMAVKRLKMAGRIFKMTDVECFQLNRERTVFEDKVTVKIKSLYFE